MNILVINDVHTIGGATMSLKEFIISLIEDGNRVTVCTSRYDGFNRFLDSRNITNIIDGHIEAMESVFPDFCLYRLFRRYLYYYALNKSVRIIEKKTNVCDYDLIYTNSARNDVGCVLSRKYGIPHVMHIREFGVEDFSCTVHRKDYYSYLSENCDVFLAVSNAVKNAWIKRGIKQNKVLTVYNGIDFRKTIVKDNYSRNEKLKMVFAGTVCDTKGQYIAIEAMSRLPDRIKKNIELDLIGWCGSVYLFKLNRKLCRLGLERNVKYLGVKNNVAEVLSDYDIGIMCSKSEGFGRVTAEYMFAGLGIIAADTGSTPELIENGVTGIVYHRDESRDLADKILMFYNNRELIERYGRRAHEEARRRFSSDINYRNVLGVFKKVLDEDKIRSNGQ